MLLLEAATVLQETQPKIWETWQFWLIGLPFILFCLVIAIGWIIEGIRPSKGAVFIG